jgi:predicted metal-dependent phosphotriesterase family hydrolase
VTDQVMTVLGPVPVEDLGVTLPHEHIFVDLSKVNRNIATLFDDLERMVHETSRFREAGGTTLVDVTPRNVGRRPESLRAVAQRTGLNIVMATGWYREPWYEPIVFRSSVDACAALLIEEIRTGVPGLDIRAGIIGEMGTDDAWLTPVEERGFRAAARAHRATGLTVTTHAFGCDVGLRQLDLLVEEGMPPGRVIVGHCDTFLDPGYLDALLDRGAWVQFDTIRVRNEWDFQRRADQLQRIIAAGRGHQLLLSQDICFRDLLATNGGRGYTCLLEDFLPWLVEQGTIDEGTGRRLVIDNPQRALVGEPVPW